MVTVSVSDRLEALSMPAQLDVQLIASIVFIVFSVLEEFWVFSGKKA